MRFKLVSCLWGGVFVGVTLAGCASLDEMEAENYRHKCESLGIKANSPDFNNCMLQQQAIEEQSIQRSLDRSMTREVLKR